MARYTDDSKERVRDAVDMAEVVSARTELRRAGAGFTGLCPFHDERSPSLSVDPVRKLFHCFGCGEGGDVFAFVQKTENVDFVGALELLADRSGVQLDRVEEDPREAERRERRERLLELLERTATFYVRFLWESREAHRAREYLASRGLEEATLREFRVGYAPSTWDTVLQASRRNGFGARELYDAGLAQRAKGEGRLYDRFRGRLMFPLADARGRVLGFGARALGDDRGPKYLNTAENELFHKGRHLYAADIARTYAARSGATILCEGYTDVIALHQAGLSNAVATMGTALTPDQVGELAKLAPVVQLALDADAAGQRAMLRAAGVAAGRQLQLRVVPLPSGLDPADLVRRDGPDAMRALVERSVVFVEFQVDRVLAGADRSSAEGKDTALRELRPLLSQLPPSVLREELFARITDALDVRGELAAAVLWGRGGGGGSRQVAGSAPPGSVAAARPRLDPTALAERAFLARCLAVLGRGKELLRSPDLDEYFTDELTRRAAGWFRDQLEAPSEDDPPDEEVATLVRQLRARAATLESDPGALDAERLRLAISRIERQMKNGDGPVPDLAVRRAALTNELHAAVLRSPSGPRSPGERAGSD